MVTETKTIHKTIEKEVTEEIEITRCDCCGQSFDDDQIETVAVNPEYERNRKARIQFPNWDDARHGPHNPHIGFARGMEEAAQSMDITTWEDAERVEELAVARKEIQKLRHEIHKLKGLPKGKLAADCLFDVCHGCLKGFLDAEPSEDDIETPRIVERDLKVEQPKLIDYRVLMVASALSFFGAIVQYMDLVAGVPGLMTGAALTIIALYVIQEWGDGE